ncbi:MAG: hypothetical protein PHR39_04695 [Actinomycetota bacterium]|nr:hypothetical protein [Actinomycetota bacterium]
MKYETLGTTEDLSEDTRSKYIEAKNKLQLAEESKSPDTKTIAREYLAISEIAKQEIIDSQTKQKQETKKEIKPAEDKLAKQIKDSYKETKTDRELTPEEKKKLKSLNKFIFGNEKVEIVERLTTKDGHKALGAYINGVIKIVDGKGNPQDTYLHEAVHKYIDLFMSQSEKVNLFLAAKEKYGDLKVANLEEKIAEGFIKYMNTRTGIFGKLKLSFDTLSNRIKLYLIPDNRQSIEDFYNDIATGKARAVSQEI